ncbi:MAG: hypothetical protein ACREOP_14620, partial [Thermodesulfobacteriota bacterium]
MNHIYYSSVISRVGQVFVLSNEKGVSRIIFGEKEFRNYLEGFNGARVVEGGAAADMARELGLYFD